MSGGGGDEGEAEMDCFSVPRHNAKAEDQKDCSSDTQPKAKAEADCCSDPDLIEVPSRNARLPEQQFHETHGRCQNCGATFD